MPNMMTGRIANRLNLRGPNYVLDAACASSLAGRRRGDRRTARRPQPDDAGRRRQRHAAGRT
ncbi:MAG: hypothetical protein MZW92_75040 [Comamonadaceae bacterium]|nr:hypothetical protein [Comamonadaceae bacterium]